MLDRQDERLRSEGNPTLAGAQNHPEEAMLAAFMRGELPRDQARAVVRHLLRECSRLTRGGMPT